MRKCRSRLVGRRNRKGDGAGLSGGSVGGGRNCGGLGNVEAVTNVQECVGPAIVSLRSVVKGIA